jgi:hypothetical protein
MLALMALGYALISLAREQVGAFRGRTPRSGHAQMLPYRQPVRPWCYKLESGAYLAAFAVDASDGDEHGGDALGREDAQLSKAIREVTPDCAAWLRTRYVAEKGYDKPRRYPNEVDLAGGVLEFLDEKHGEAFDGKRTFTSRRIVWVGWMPPSENTQKAAARAQTGGGDIPKTPLEREDANIAEFEKKLSTIEAYFKAAGAEVRRIGKARFQDGDGEQRWYSVLASELAWAIGHERRRFRLPDAALQDGAGLVAAESYRGGYDLRIGRREFAIIVVKAFPDRTWPRKLSFLKRLGVEYETVVRFLPWSEDEALKQANAARSDWLLNESGEAGGDDYMAERAQQGSTIKGEVRRGDVRFGDASVYIVLSSLSRAAVNEAAQKAVALLDREEIKSFVATITAEADYLAGLPGITDYAVRQFPLHSLNVVHLANLHRESTGRRWNDAPTVPPATPALTQAISDENEIVRLHWNHEPLDVFAHARVGAMGTGKSVQIAHEALAFLSRMPMAGVTIFDKGRSSYRVTRFLDGVFNDLLGHNSPGFALYRDIEDAGDHGALLGILQAIIALQNVPMTVTKDDALERALNNVLSEDEDIRSHSLLCEIVQDPEGSMKRALSTWKRDNPVVGNVLDRERDAFDFRRWNVIEQGRILQPSFPAKYRIPIIAAIYWKSRKQVRRMKERLNRYDLYWLFEQDEAHSMMEDEQGCRFIKEMFREARREQLVLGLSSQYMEHFTESPVWPDIKGALQVWEYFGNSALRQQEVESRDRRTLRQQYAESGLSARGIGLVATCPQFRFVYYSPKSRELKRVRMEFDRATLAIIARTRASDNARVDEFIARHPDSWRWELLKYEDVPARDIARLRELYESYREAAQVFESERTA